MKGNKRAGGRRGNPTSGRKKGTPNRIKGRRQLEAEAQALATDGETPLVFLLRVMRNTRQPVDVRINAAKAAAPYCHPALRSIDFKGSMTVGISAALHAFISGNVAATRSFVDFDQEDQDPQEAADGRSLPHH